MNELPTPGEDDAEQWGRLNEKHRACLDLLLQRKTSKQIALILDISKPTVDQRLKTARDILGAADRDGTAIRYATLKRIYDRIAYDPVELPPPPMFVPSDFSNGGPSSLLDLHDNSRAGHRLSGASSPFRDLFRHDHAVRWRIGIIIATITAIILISSGSLTIGQMLTQLLGG